MSEILKLEGWSNQGRSLRYKYEGVDVKWLNEKAASLHKEIEEMNQHLITGKFVIKTLLIGLKKKSYFKLKVKVKFYQDKEKYEHKEDSHRQKIDI